MALGSDTDGHEFGARLSLALRACNLSRTQLSATLGVHKSLVSRWLSGEVTPTSYNLARLSAVLAGLKPGFNMTLWKAPQEEFEAALGLPPTLRSAADVAAVARPNSRDTEAVAEIPTGGRRWHPAYPVLAGFVTAALIIFGLLAWRGSFRAPTSEQQTLRPGFAPTSVAVMPFLNMSGDPTKEYLGDGISEEILNDLSNTPTLEVASRTSSFFFKGKNPDIGEIVHRLHVHAVLEGSVRQENDRIRVVAQLINAEDGFHLWSASYDRKLDDLINVQDEIARAIVLALTRKLVLPRPVRTIEPKAYQDYLQARYFMGQEALPGYQRANDLLQDAIARQPDFADAYALRGHALMVLTSIPEAQEMIAEAMKLDPENREALNTDLQMSLFTLDRAAMYRDAHRLLAMRKKDALAYSGLHDFYLFMGFPNVALDAIRQAAALDPLSFVYRHAYTIALWRLGHKREALAAAEAALALQPNHSLSLRDLCVLNASLGRIAAAREYAQRLSVQHHGEWWPGLQKECELEIAQKTMQVGEFHALLDRTDPKGIRANMALYYAKAGDLTKAIDIFSGLYDRRLVTVITTIPYDAETPKALLADPRWKALWREPLLRDWQRWHDRIAAELATSHG